MNQVDGDEFIDIEGLDIEKELQNIEMRLGKRDADAGNQVVKSVDLEKNVDSEKKEKNGDSKNEEEEEEEEQDEDEEEDEEEENGDNMDELNQDDLEAYFTQVDDIGSVDLGDINFSKILEDLQIIGANAGGSGTGAGIETGAGADMGMGMGMGIGMDMGIVGIDGASSVAEEQPKEIEEQQLQEKIIDKGEETKIINEIDSILESKISQIGLKRARTLTIGDNRAQSHPPLPSQSSSLLEPSEQGQGGSKEGDENMMNGNTKNSEDQNGDETEIARIKRARTESPKMAARDVVVEIERRISNVEAEENSNTPVEGVEEGEKGGEKEKEKETEDKTRDEEEKKLEVEQRAIVGQGAEEAENVETETETGEGEEAGSGAVEMENIEVENKTNGLENMEVEKKEEEKTSEEVEIKTEAKVVEDVEMVEDDGKGSEEEEMQAKIKKAVLKANMYYKGANFERYRMMMGQIGLRGGMEVAKSIKQMYEGQKWGRKAVEVEWNNKSNVVSVCYAEKEQQEEEKTRAVGAGIRVYAVDMGVDELKEVGTIKIEAMESNEGEDGMAQNELYESGEGINRVNNGENGGIVRGKIESKAFWDGDNRGGGGGRVAFVDPRGKIEIYTCKEKKIQTIDMECPVAAIEWLQQSKKHVARIFVDGEKEKEKEKEEEEMENIETKTETDMSVGAGVGNVEMDIGGYIRGRRNGFMYTNVVLTCAGRFLLNNNDRKDKAGSADTADELEHDGQQYIDLGVPYKDQCSGNETGVAESRESDMEGVWMITHADIRLVNYKYFVVAAVWKWIKQEESGQEQEVEVEVEVEVEERCVLYVIEWKCSENNLELLDSEYVYVHTQSRYGQQDGGIINTEDTDDMIGKRTELGRCSQNQKAKSSGSIQHVKLIQQTNPNLYNGGRNSKNDNDNDNDNEDDSKKLLELPIVALVISHIDNSNQESQNIENDIGIESNVLQFYKTKLDKNQIVHVYKNNSININDICTSVESSGRGLVNNVQVFKPTVIISHKQGGDDNETKYERLGISLSDGKYLLSNGCIDDRIRFATLFEARDDGKYCTAVNENLNSAARVKIHSTGNHGASGATLEFLYLTREQYTTIHGSVGFAKILSAQLALNLLNNANSRDVVQVIKQHFDAANQDEEDLAIHLQSVLVHSGDLLSRVLFEKNDGSANLESWIFTPTSSTFTIFRKYFELSSTILAQCKFPPSSSSVNNDPKKNTLVVAATNLKIFLEFSSILFNYQRLQRSSLFSLEYKQQQLVKFANWALTLLNFLVKETFLESKFHASLASRSEDTTNKPLCTSALLITPISLKIISDVLAFIINFLTFISSLSQSQPQTNINPNNALLQFSQYVKRTFPLQPKTLLSIVNSISQHVNNTTFAPASTYSIFDLLIKNTDPSHHNHDLRSLIFSSIQSQISSEFASDSTLLLDLIKFKNKNLDSLLVSSQHSSTPELVNNPNANPSYSIELPLFGSSSSTRSLATINSSSDPSSATPANPKPGYSLPSINMPNISLFNTPINTHNQLNYVGLQR